MAAAVVDGVLVAGDVSVADARIWAVGQHPAGRGIAVPGFVDLQVNGFGGVDFLDASPSDFAAAGRALLARGVTAYQPMFITSPVSALVPALDAAGAARDQGCAPRIIGVHLEGPFLSPAWSGTHPVEHLRRPDAPEFRSILTHPDVAHVHIGLIVDRVHLADATVLAVWRAARGRLLLVSDAVAAAGGGPGAWRLGSIDVSGREVRREDGTLAGSVLSMDQAMRNLVTLGIPLPEAVDAASRVPARLVGRAELGTIAPGATGDVVILDDGLRVARVLVAARDVL